jgi:transposase
MARPRSNRYIEFSNNATDIRARFETEKISLLDIWRQYAATGSLVYKHSQFSAVYRLWCKANHIKRPPKNTTYLNTVRESDIIALKNWKHSGNRHLWERSTAIRELSSGETLVRVCSKIERSSKTIKRWLKIYNKEGLAALASPQQKSQSQYTRDRISEQGERLIKLIDEPPSLHGINRTLWSLATLSAIYEKTYERTISKSTVSELFRKSGYKFKKARKTLTSCDPNFREKLRLIRKTLSELANDEKFFSIDEFGPFSVKIRGGRALVPGHVVRTFPQKQNSKGRIICTAALELSTNQLTHFYSQRKNSREMIKLLIKLAKSYTHEKRIFISWDSASWHASKAVYKKVDELNGEQFRCANLSPLIELRPLPTGAQFLNVIESVFSGMSRAILHNSDYQSVDECKTAIDTYISDRNIAFTMNPMRAGKKIWGEERVESVFKEGNNCKDPRWR